MTLSDRASHRATHGFQTPQSIEDAERRHGTLVVELHNIEAQLGNRNATGPDGQRKDSSEYWDWRNRAIIARKHVLAEMRALKAWIKEQRRVRIHDRAANEGYDARDPESLLRAAYHLMGDVEGDDVLLLRDAIQDYLSHGRADDNSRAETTPEGDGSTERGPRT